MQNNRVISQLVWGTGADTSLFREYQMMRNSVRMVKAYTKFLLPVGIYVVWLGYPAFPGFRKDVYEFFVPPAVEK
ncbi:hypothetical protein BASA81_004030 [Batrachochytrium salamandrivorans]|nr:hypothetical protein BASA81_004030 [Batrachochytrium salamandrivorans]